MKLFIYVKNNMAYFMAQKLDLELQQLIERNGESNAYLI